MLPFGPQHAVVGGGHGTPAALFVLAGLLAGLLAWRLAGLVPRARP
jgi:hypothetical protein